MEANYLVECYFCLLQYDMLVVGCCPNCGSSEFRVLDWGDDDDGGAADSDAGTIA